MLLNTLDVSKIANASSISGSYLENVYNSSQVKYNNHGPIDDLVICMAVSLMVLIIVTGSIGNLMVIIAVKTTKKLQTISNIFVVNLSICDLVFVMGVLPFSIYTYINDGWYLGDELCLFVGFLGYTLTGTTIITITMIAFNRYKLILDLSSYKSLFTPQKMAMMLFSAWFFPIICLVPALFEVWGKFSYVPMLVTCNLVLDHNSQLFKLFLLVIRAGIPCILIMFYYIMIFHKTRSNHRRVIKRCLMSSLDRNNHKKEMHLTRMMIAIFIAFIVSYFPCTITGMIDWNTVLSKQFHMFCAISIYIESAVNPFIYGLMNRQFRQAYVRILCCKTDSSNHSMASTNRPLRNYSERNFRGLDILDGPEYWLKESTSISYDNQLMNDSSKELLQIDVPLLQCIQNKVDIACSTSSTETSFLEPDRNELDVLFGDKTQSKLQFKYNIEDIPDDCDMAKFYLDTESI